MRITAHKKSEVQISNLQIFKYFFSLNIIVKNLPHSRIFPIKSAKFTFAKNKIKNFKSPKNSKTCQAFLEQYNSNNKRQSMRISFEYYVLEKTFGIILDWAGKIFQIFPRQNDSNWFENSISKIYRAARKRTLTLVSEVLFKILRDLA